MTTQAAQTTPQPPTGNAQLDAYGLTDEIGAAKLFGDVPPEQLSSRAKSADSGPSAGG